MATSGLYGSSPTGAVVAAPGSETSGLYGSSPTGATVASPGSETAGLYGNATVFGGTYFEWFIFIQSATQPATPTGGSWNFTSNVGTPPTGWSTTPPSAPTLAVWGSIALVNSANASSLTWSAPGLFAYAQGLPVLSGADIPLSGDGVNNQLYVQTGSTPQTIWLKESGTWTRLTGSTLYVDLVNNQTIGGTKTFSSQIQGSVSGTASNVTGVVAIGNGGTGQATANSALNALLPSQTSNANKVLTTDGSNSYWQVIAGTGTVTSVNVSGGTTGLTTSGGPVTTSGTITLAGTLGVGNGGTGVTASSGANSVMLRDANQNVAVNAIDDGYTNFAASGTTTTLTVASARRYTVTGSGGHTFKLPDATTLVNGAIFEFDNNQSSGAILVNNNSNTLIVSVPSGGITRVDLLSNSIAAGSWDRHDLTPANVSWSTNTFDYPGSITSATWNGATVQLNRGGTGQTTAQAAMNSFAGAVTLGSYLRGNGTNVVMSAIQVSDVPTLNQNTTGTAANVTGIVAIANGGTGQTTANTAFNALAPSQTGNSGKYLTTDGSNTSWATNPLGTVTSVAATVPSFLSISGSPITTSGTLAIGYSGTALPVANGGTGLTSYTNQGILYASGTGSLSNNSGLITDGSNIALGSSLYGWSTYNYIKAIQVSFWGNLVGSGNGLAMLSNAYYSGSPSNAYYLYTGAAAEFTTNLGTFEWKTAASGTAGTLATFATRMSLDNVGNLNIANLTASKVVFSDASKNLTSTGTVSVAQGGTGTSTPALVAGTNVTITGTWPNQTINSSNPGGTVTSVAATVPSFLSITGSPITSSGTLAISYSGTALPIANGGTGQTTASAAFNALSPITTTGDLIIGNGTNNATRLAIGTNGYILTSNGTTASWTAAPATGVTSFSAGTTGFTPNVATTGAVTLAGTLATTNGGTGLTSFTANGIVYASSTSALTTGSALTFDGTDIASTGSVRLNNGQYYYGKNAAGTAVRLLGINAGNENYVGAIDNGPTIINYGIASTIANQIWYVGGSEQMRLTSSNLNIASLTASKVVFTDASKNLTSTGTVAVANGGTGLTTTPANGALDIGNGTGFTRTTLTAGSGVTITNASGSITINATGTGGDVVGPSSATNNGIALFDGTTGKLIKDSASVSGLIQGLTVGKGASAVSTNSAFGVSALAANTSGANNTAVGYQAGFSNTTGDKNLFVGSLAGRSNTTGIYNSFAGGQNSSGYGAGYTNTTGQSNTAFGSAALGLNTTASNNTAVGAEAGFNNTTGASNSFFGNRSAVSNTTGSYNIAIGDNALSGNTTNQQMTALGYQAGYNLNGQHSVAIGWQAGYGGASWAGNSSYDSVFVGGQAGYNTTAEGSVFVGYNAGYNNTSGSNNVAIGRAALQANTTSSNNTAVGYQAGYSNVTGTDVSYFGRNSGYQNTGSYNTALGAAALYASGAGNYNTAVGATALFFNTSGGANIAIGGDALRNNTTASNNTAVGYQAAYSNTTGQYSTFVGYQAGYSRTTANNLTAIGHAAAYSTTTGGTDSVAIGNNAMYTNSTGTQNVAIGKDSLYNNTTASNNTAIGYQAGYSNTTGDNNVFVGRIAGIGTTTGNYLTAVGSIALQTNSTGTNSVAVGTEALRYNTTGNYNTAIGSLALNANTTASNNTAVGYQAGYSNTTGDIQVFGYQAGYANTTGFGITAVGGSALRANTTGYYNTAVGQLALTANTTGIQNTAVGELALTSNTTGGNNVAMGMQALQANTTASNNTAVGYQALYSNTTTDAVVAVGWHAGYSKTTTGSNFAQTYVGTKAGYSNQTGIDNTYIGGYAGYTSTGSYNTVLGSGALYSNTSASNNTAVGYTAGYSNTTGGITAVGQRALYANTTGADNVAMGVQALNANTTGGSNTAIGHTALTSNTTAIANTAVGYQAGYSQTGSDCNANTYLGYKAGYTTSGVATNNLFAGAYAGYSNTTGIGNTYVGGGFNYGAGYYMTTGSKNTIIGSFTGNQGGLDIRTASNYIVLSDGDGNPRGIFDNAGSFSVGTTDFAGANTGGFQSYYGAGASRLYIGHVSGTVNGTQYIVFNYNGTSQIGSITQSGTTAVLYNVTSDQRLKENIQDADSSSSLIDSLQVRKFDWKTDQTHQRYGFIAQELVTVAPEAVHQPQDTEQMMAVDYSKLVPMLVKEIQSLRKRLAALEAK